MPVQLDVPLLPWLAFTSKAAVGPCADKAPCGGWHGQWSQKDNFGPRDILLLQYHWASYLCSLSKNCETLILLELSPSSPCGQSLGCDMMLVLKCHLQALLVFTLKRDGTQAWHWGLFCANHSVIDQRLLSFFPTRDLSMNNISRLQPRTFRHLRFLEEL